MTDTEQMNDTPSTHTVRVEGELDIDTVPVRLKRSADWFENGQDTIIDLGGVSRADSAGVALLLEWVRDAAEAGSELRYVNAPDQIRAIVDFCGLNEVISVSSEAA